MDTPLYCLKILYMVSMKVILHETLFVAQCREELMWWKIAATKESEGKTKHWSLLSFVRHNSGMVSRTFNQLLVAHVWALFFCPKSVEAFKAWFYYFSWAYFIFRFLLLIGCFCRAKFRLILVMVVESICIKVTTWNFISITKSQMIVNLAWCAYLGFQTFENPLHYGGQFASDFHLSMVAIDKLWATTSRSQFPATPLLSLAWYCTIT